MDARFEVVRAKSRKLYGKEHVNRPRRLSELPDELIYHILSFLPMKNAVRTCVLAKRWRYLWASLPNLKFHETDFPERSIFMNFVEKAFIFRDRSTIKSLSLSCDVLSDAPRINAWIIAASRGDLVELSLELNDPKEPFTLPCCIFESRNLYKFELDVFDVHWHRSSVILRCPSSASLSCLKVLILREVTFVDCSSVDKLFSSPLLEELSIEQCRWKSLKTITISAPKLLKLSIHDFDVDKECASYDRLVKISGVSLKSLYYEGGLINRYRVDGSVTQLVEAAVCMRPHGDENYVLVAKNVLELLVGVSGVVSLTVNGWFFKVLDIRKELLEALPLFSTLTKLRVNYMEPPPDEIGGLLPLLRRLPSITTLDINEYLEGLFEPEELLEDVPPCFRTKLKRIEICPFWDHPCNLSQVQALLKAATVLEEMVIFANVRDIDKESLSEKLMLFPRGLNCRITLIPRWASIAGKLINDVGSERSEQLHSTTNQPSALLMTPSETEHPSIIESLSLEDMSGSSTTSTPEGSGFEATSGSSLPIDQWIAGDVGESENSGRSSSKGAAKGEELEFWENVNLASLEEDFELAMFMVSSGLDLPAIYSLPESSTNGYLVYDNLWES